MSLQEINNNQQIIETLKLNLENLLGISVTLKLSQESGKFVYTFTLPNAVGNRLSEALALIKPTLVVLSEKPSCFVDIKVSVANEITYYEVYNNLHQWSERLKDVINIVLLKRTKISPQKLDYLIGIEPKETLKLAHYIVELNSIIDINLQDYITDSIVLDSILIGKINFVKHEITKLENQETVFSVTRLPNEEVGAGMDEVKNLVTILNDLKQAVTEALGSGNKQNL
ncbi:MAG: hypothetical protein RM347_004220 [Nostoc sp. ChiQUE02]|uniref:hypothetical protein n=1 Tax=Nostoc sp. ChiQUE02 TaxID=3075377 RepID=UPI002AD374EE|nr:hypothetical protein [Nostoc sp. ChiQUE02]MDZ8231984.1 hypothetical protein [Nostoc sp. ChiQUE02]